MQIFFISKKVLLFKTLFLYPVYKVVSCKILHLFLVHVTYI